MADPTTNNLTDEERQRLLAATSQPIIPSMHSIPPLPHAEEAKLMGGGTITPAAQRGMVPPTAGAMGISPGTPQYGEQNQQRLDYQKMFPWGTPQNHPGTWGKIGHVLGTIGNVAGQLAPGIAEAVPGSFQNRQMQERQNEKWINLGGENELRQAQAAKAQADVPYEQEETKHLQATTPYVGPLAESEVAERNARSAALLHPQAKTDFEAWQQQNPGKPIEDWLKTVAANKPEAGSFEEKEFGEWAKKQQELGKPADRMTFEKTRPAGDIAQQRLGITQSQLDLTRERLKDEEAKTAEARQQFNPAIAQQVVQATGTMASTRRLLQILEPYKDDNQPFGSFLKTVEYRLGKAQADQIGQEIAAINLTSLQQGGSVLKGMGGVRSAQVLDKVLQHTPDPMKDSTKLMYDKMLNIDRATALFLQDADKYGRKQGAEIPAENMKPYAVPGGGGGGGVTVSAGGESYSFPDQKSADAFRKEAGIK